MNAVRIVPTRLPTEIPRLIPRPTPEGPAQTSVDSVVHDTVLQEVRPTWIDAVGSLTAKFMPITEMEADPLVGWFCVGKYVMIGPSKLNAFTSVPIAFAMLITAV